MDDGTRLAIAFLLGLIFMIVVTISLSYDNGYRQGQIDAINGSIHWQLEEQADGSMQWSECDGVCER